MCDRYDTREGKLQQPGPRCDAGHGDWETRVLHGGDKAPELPDPFLVFIIDHQEMNRCGQADGQQDGGLHRRSQTETDRQ